MFVLKVIRINLLSLFTIFLFLLAFASKILETFLQRILMIKHVIILLAYVIIIYEAITHWNWNTVGEIIAVFFLAGSFVALIIGLLEVLGLIAFILIAYIWVGINYFFSASYVWCYSAAIKLTNICKRDFQFICLSGKRLKNFLCCIFYYLSEGIKKLINIISLGAIVISIIFSAGCAVLLGVLANNYSENKLNINMFQTFQQLDNITKILNAAAYLIIVIGILIITISIGSDLRTWAQELFRPIEFKNDINIYNKNEEISKIRNREDFIKYKNLFYDNIQDIEELSKEIDQIYNQSKNTEIIIAWNEYFRDVVEISSAFETFNEKGKVSTYAFQILIPKIKNIQRQHENLKSQVEKLKEKIENPLSQAVFFSGCDTLEKLEKRHKILSKAYHPDVGGDEATFVKMQGEYENLKSIFTREKNFCNV